MNELRLLDSDNPTSLYVFIGCDKDYKVKSHTGRALSLHKLMDESSPRNSGKWPVKQLMKELQRLLEEMQGVPTTFIDVIAAVSPLLRNPESPGTESPFVRQPYIPKTNVDCSGAKCSQNTPHMANDYAQ